MEEEEAEHHILLETRLAQVANTKVDDIAKSAIHQLDRCQSSQIV